MIERYPAGAKEDAFKRSLDPTTDGKIGAVRDFWEVEVANWKVAKYEPGLEEFFAETEAYRFEKLGYLSRVVDFSSYEDCHVLDIGCGIANDTSRFASGGARTVGIDITKRAIGLAKRNFRQRGLAGDFVVMNGECMTFDDDAFDVVYCHTVLQFTPDPARVVSEAYRVLRPGGKAIFMIVSSRSWLRFLHRCFGIGIDYLEAPVFQWFSPREFRRLLRPFRDPVLVFERFPVPTRIQTGLKATVFNAAFVGLFNALPRALTRWSAHHILAFVSKPDSAAPDNET